MAARLHKHVRVIHLHALFVSIAVCFDAPDNYEQGGIAYDYALREAAEQLSTGGNWNQMTVKQIAIGEFEVTGTVLTISDPCYEPDTWCMGELTGVKPGVWEAYIGICHDQRWGERVAYLAAYHKDCPDKQRLIRCDAPFEVGVDSGQAGIFDSAHYKDAAVVSDVLNPINGDDLWYSACCNQTLKTEHGAGIIPYGVVSSSGFGDGGYACSYFADKKGEGRTVWGALIDFDLVRMRTIMEKLLQQQNGQKTE